MLTNLLRRNHASVGAPDLITRERPSLPTNPAALAPEPREDNSLLDEYSRLTKSLGLANPHIDADLRVERFKAFLRKKDWAVFSLSTVTEYMDKKSAEESAAKAGWHWRPLRMKDNIRDARFGQEAFRRSFSTGTFSSREDMERAASIPDHVQTASDHYHGPHNERQMQWSNGGQRHTDGDVEVPASAGPYDKLVPLHALRKVAAIEAEFTEPVSFFVCDYAPAPHIEHPDPFLMAVVNNARLSQGVGRFVIDFWDEPGFGLDKQLA